MQWTPLEVSNRAMNEFAELFNMCSLECVRQAPKVLFSMHDDRN